MDSEGIKSVILQHSIKSYHRTRGGDGFQKTPDLVWFLEVGRQDHKEEEMGKGVVEAVAVQGRLSAPETYGNRGRQER